MAALFGAGSGGHSLSVNMTDAYDPGITNEVDRQIRHMQVVYMHCLKQAGDLMRATGSKNFETISAFNPRGQRPRVYVTPSNAEGIHEELSDSVLLKAAMGRAGK